MGLMVNGSNVYNKKRFGLLAVLLLTRSKLSIRFVRSLLLARSAALEEEQDDADEAAGLVLGDILCRGERERKTLFFSDSYLWRQTDNWGYYY